MLTLEVRPFANLIFALVELQKPLKSRSDLLPDDAIKSFNEGTAKVATQCDELELAVSAEMARQCFHGITRYQDVRERTNLLMNTLFIELNNRKFYAPIRNLIRYYEQVKLFGDGVFTNFPSANDDIEEAGTCLALERATACVLHLNRALEVGLRALAATLGVSKKNDWGSYIREIGIELSARMKTASVRSPDEQFYAEAVSHFDSLRRAYRNPTMHPEKSYSVDRAEEILLATKSFMSHLAARISE